MLFRYYMLLGLLSIVLVWPIKFLISFYFRRKRILQMVKGAPFLEDYPFIGVCNRFIGLDNKGIMQTLNKIVTENETPVCGFLGPQFLIMVDKPEDIQTVISSKGCFEKGQMYRFIKRTLGLFAAPYHIWKPQRKQLSTSFNLSIIQSFVPIFNSKADLLVRNVGKEIGKGDFDLTKYTSPCTLDIVCETAMGSAMEIQNGENTDYMEALAGLLAIIARRIVNIFLHLDFIYEQTSLYRLDCDYLARVEYLPGKMIKERMEKFVENDDNASVFEPNEDDNGDKQYEKPQIFIDRLISLYNKGLLTEGEIRDHVNLVIFGANDTSSFTASNAILLLAMHPQYEDRVMNEIYEIFDDSPIDVEITTEHINRLVYLEQVIKETLRILPSGPYLLRHCTGETKLADITIPVGTEIILAVYSAHRRKDVWGPDADEFNPDHFSADATSKRNPYAFMGFSQGPRNCIGYRFALMSLKVMLVKLLRKYKFSTKLRLDDLQCSWEVTSKLICGPMVSVKERSQSALGVK